MSSTRRAPSLSLVTRSLGGAAAAVADAAAVAGAAAVAAAGEAAAAVAAAVVAAGDGAVAAGRHTAFKSRGRLKSPGQHYGGWPGLMCASVPTERAIGTQAQCSAAVNRRVRLGQACFVAAYQAGSRVARACGRALESSPCRPGPTSVASERPCSSVILIFAIP
jgi:hypothetical protein